MNKQQKIIRGRKEYSELKRYVESLTLTFEEFYHREDFSFNKHNYDGELFDIDYKTICTTIHNVNGRPVISKSYEVWENYGELLFEHVEDIL